MHATALQRALLDDNAHKFSSEEWSLIGLVQVTETIVTRAGVFFVRGDVTLGRMVERSYWLAYSYRQRRIIRLPKTEAAYVSPREQF